jgi:hypothetical protein
MWMTLRSAQRSEPRGASKRLLAALLVSLWLPRSAHVSAQTSEPLELQWAAPQGCPKADDVRARVRELAGSSPLTGELRAEATIARRSDGGFHLRLVVRADDLVGERNIDAKSCADLAGAAAVALALLLRSSEPLSQADLMGRPTDSNALTQTNSSRRGADSDAAAQGERASAAGLTDDESAGTRATSTVAAPEPASARRDVRSTRRFRGLLQAPLLALGFGPLRKASFGLALAAGAALGPWVLLADGKAWLPQSVDTVHEAERYEADVLHFAAGLRGCRALLWPRFQLAPCVLLSVEHASARGTGPHIVSSKDKASWIAAGIGAQGRFNLTAWLNLVAGIDVQFQTAQPTIAIDGVGTIAQLLPVAVTVTLGSEWIL